MVQKNLLTILVVLVVGSALVLIFNPNESAIPPTPAFNTFIINSNATYSSTGQDNVTALVYNDELYIISDGSIGMNITSYTP